MGRRSVVLAVRGSRRTWGTAQLGKTARWLQKAETKQNSRVYLVAGAGNPSPLYAQRYLVGELAWGRGAGNTVLSTTG